MNEKEGVYMQETLERKEATDITKKFQDGIRKNIDENEMKREQRLFSEMKNHLILSVPLEKIKNDYGDVIWDRASLKYLRENTDNVNPYLLNHAKNGLTAGIVELIPNVAYQTYGFASSMIIRSDNGFILVGSGNSEREADYVISLFEKALNENVRNNIKAVIITLSQTDYYGGLNSYIGDTFDGKIYGPGRYLESITADNLSTGIAMSRRVEYQCGLFLPHDDKGFVSVGVNGVMGIYGKVSNRLPDIYIEENSKINIDGLDFEFTLTPETEMLAHMVIYDVRHGLLFLTNNVEGTLHNTLTMRGAQVRDGNVWGKLLFGLYEKYRGKLKVVCAGHGIPIWEDKNQTSSETDIEEFMLDNAVAYKYTNDQALLMANQGYTLNEIGRNIKIPESIKHGCFTRGHYGDYTFNARAAYQKYLGFYDGNPVNLFPLSEVELAKKLIEYMESEDAILRKAEDDFNKGNYQWVATITNHIVYANPKNIRARALCADSLEQLAYQSESAIWRNAYLSAAMDLRIPNYSKQFDFMAMDNREKIPYASIEMLLDHLGINYDGYAANVNGDDNISLLLTVNEENHILRVYKGTILHYKTDRDSKEFQYHVKTDKEGLYLLAIGRFNEAKGRFDSNCMDLLEKLALYVVDTSKYRRFSLCEPEELLHNN